ncbi:MAG: hypothetical protein MJY59_02285 [Bacteroidaceae bacterium]|nr:hypothetical protein [Bacteroidaceae bacterium]
MTEVYNKEAESLIKDMKLKKDKKDMFKVLYLDYQNARFNAVNPNGGDQEVKEAVVDLKSITDENADSLIQNSFKRQERELAVAKEYYKKFLDILTPAQAAYVFLSPSADAMTPGRMMGGMMGGFGGGMPMGGFGGGMPMGGFGGGMPMGGFGGGF